MKDKTMKLGMQRLASLIVTGILFAVVECGQAQIKNPSGGVYLPVMKTNGVVPSLAHAFDDLKVNGTVMPVNTVNDLETVLELLQSEPPVPMASVPRNEMGGVTGIGFWSLQNPDWPPLPGDPFGLNVWPIGNGRFVLADSQYNYNPAPKVKSKAMMKASLDPGDPGDGSGDTNTFYSGDVTSFAQSYTTNDLWLQIVGQNNFVSSLVINTPWNVTGSNFMFDVFATTNLLPSVPGLNGTNWMFVTRSLPGQTNLTISPLPGAPICFYRLGTMQDTDGDGLTDAFEKLVSHTDPNLWDSNGNGIGDGDELSPNGFPWRLEEVRRSSAIIYADIPTATQGSGCGEATVYLPSPAPPGGTTVQYYLGGTAGLNADYTVSPAANSLFIPYGSSNGIITICANAGSTYSSLNLYADITLTNAQGYQVDNTPARVKIVDTGSPGIRVFALPQWTRRPSATYGTNVAGFYFVRDGQSTNALTIGLSYAGGTATTNGDYATLPKTITFPANVRTNWIPVFITPNSTNPADKTLVLTITNAPGYAIDPTNGTATVTLAATAAPVLPVVQITANVPIATTNTAGQFTITRSFASSSPLRVYLHEWNAASTVISSSNGLDTTTYATLPGYVDIQPNAASVSLSLTATRQLSVPQPVTVTLAAGDYTISTNNAATVTLDAVGPIGVTVTLARNGLHNGSSGWLRPAQLTFTRTGSVASPMTLAWFNVTSGGLGFNATGGQLAGFAVGSSGQGQIVLPAGQSVWKTNYTISYVWNDPGVPENDDGIVYSSITFSNAYTYTTVPAYFYPSWEMVQISSIFSPATTLTNGTSLPNALYISRPYTRTGIGPQHGLTVTISTSGGSAVSGTDFTMNTTVNLAAADITALIPVQALNATGQGWRTLVAKLDPAANNQAVPDANVDTAYVRFANPNNLVDDTDMDGDGIPDGFELSHLANGLDPITPNNPYADADRDGIGLMEELSLGLNPNVADNPPTYPSIEDSDYVNLTMRVGASGKMLTEPVSSCAVCHAVTMRAGSYIKSTSLTSRTQPTQVTDYLVRLARGTNYPVQVTCNPFASSLLTSNQAAATTTPHYTAAYVAQFLADTNSTVYPFIVDTNKLLGTNLPMVQEVLPKRATLYIPDLTIATDVDRSGVIDFKSRTDRTSATNPFVFWINDDVDSGSDNAAGDLTPTNNPVNSSSATINGLRDLEDFARLQFKIDGLPPQFLTNGNYQVKVYVTNLVGTPSIRLFPSADLSGSLSYLTNTNAANAQLTYTSFLIATSSVPLTIDKSLWQTAGNNSFFLPWIFEGISTGSCVVTFGFSSNNAPPVAVSRPFYLNLQRVTSLYEHWTAGDNTTTDWNGIPDYPSRTVDSGVFGVPKNSDDLDTIIFVHGWRMQPWERRAFASTAYKRLYWQNYKGRFEFFSWPTDWVDLGSGSYKYLSFWSTTLPNGILRNQDNFDVSERRAWTSGTPLMHLLDAVDKTDHGRIRLMAHSMGNVVVAEALRQATDAGLKNVIHTYVALEGATPAHCYDTNATARSLNAIVIGGVHINSDSGTFNLYRYFWSQPSILPPNTPPDYTTWKPYLYDVNAATTMVNYYNSSDAALSGWQINEDLKPDLNWYYDQYGFHRYFPLARLDILADRYEIFSRIAEARCYAMGAQANLGGPFNLNQVDLNASFGFTDADNDHSAAFNSIVQNRFSFWGQVLTSMQIIH